jgi:Lipoprotein confined to pathogenic Mycobacterium
MVTPRRTEHGQYRVAALAFLMCTSILIGSCSLTENPYESKTLEGQEAVQLIDSMRANGSFEDARQRLNATARTIAERIVAAVADQTWQFNTDPNVQRVKAGGLPCEKLTGSIAGRPMADVVEFGRTFSTEEFTTARDIVRQEAAPYGATDESSLFNDPARRDYDLQGNGFEFNLMQSKAAILNITGDCFLMQAVIDLPAGQMPPKPPLTPNPPRPTP